MIDTDLKDRVVLITGANNPHGIGAATAKAFAAQGAKVFLHYFRAERSSGEVSESPGEAFYYHQQGKGPDEVLEALRDLGARVHAEEADLADTARIPALFDQAEQLLGPVEILVNNAAAWEADTFIPPSAGLRNELVELWTKRPSIIDPGIFDRLFAVNTRAVALMMAEFTQRHLARGDTWGRIVNISTAGAECFPSEISYGASKLALEGYTRSAALELGQFGDHGKRPLLGSGSDGLDHARAGKGDSADDSARPDRPAGGRGGRDRFLRVRTGALGDGTEDLCGWWAWDIVKAGHRPAAQAARRQMISFSKSHSSEWAGGPSPKYLLLSSVLISVT